MQTALKKSSIAVLLLIVLMFGGCSFFEKQAVIPQGTEEEKLLDKRTGTVQVQLDAQTREVKHVLSTENGESITLVSLNIQLDRYVGRKVQVEGLFEERENTLQVEDVTTLSEELSVKKSYVNGKLGVSFNYPANWSLEDSTVAQESALYIYPYNVPASERVTLDTVSIMRLDNPERTVPRDWLKLDEFFRPIGENREMSTYQESVIGKQQYAAVKTVSESPYIVTFWVQRDVHMYQVNFQSKQPQEKTTNENAYYELISSFDFVPFTDVSIGTVTTPLPNAATLPSLLPPSSPVASVSTNPELGKYADNTFLLDYEKFLSLEGGGLQSLDPQTKSDQQWTIIQYEFSVPDVNAPPTGVYITYAHNTDTYRLYATYQNSTNPASTKMQATFTLNSVGAWILSSGTDTGKGVQKVIVNPTTKSTSVVKAGMQLIESRLFKAKFQIPSKWYWSITPDGYAFDSKPLAAGKDALIVLSNKQGIGAGDALMTPLGKNALLGGIGDKKALCLNLPKSNYCLLYTDTTLDQAMLLSILDSIVEN